MEHVPVESSNVASIGYDPESQTLEVQFVNGGLYSYGGVPDGLFEQFRDSNSPGRFFQSHIKGQYETRKS